MISVEGVDGVFAGGLEGGVETEDGADDDGDVEDGEEDLPAKEGGEGSNDGDEESKEVAEEEAGKGAEEAEDEALKEELEEDVHVRGADGFADADFVGAFGNGDEHNVHNADAANDEGDAGNEGEHAGNDLEEGASRVGDGVAVRNGEVGVARFGLDERIGDLLGGGSEGVGGGGLDVDLLDLEIIIDVDEAGDGDDDGVVEVNVIKIDGVVDGGKNTGDEEALAVGGKGLADGLGGAEEFEGELATDDGGVERVFLIVGGVLDEIAGFEREIENFLEIGGGANECARFDGAIFGLQGIDINREGGDGGNGGEGFDSREITKGKVGFGELVGRGEFRNDAVDGGLMGGGADNNEVGTDGFDLVGDEVRDAAGEA